MTNKELEENKIKCLLWCNRHCCLCDKVCGINIEIHHIEKNSSDDIDNLMPLCFTCHADVEHYNEKHPKGNKYRIKELKTRRNQIYEKYTRHLVPPISFGFTQTIEDAPPNTQKRKLPNIGFYLRHEGIMNPVRVLIKLKVFLGEKNITEDIKYGKGYYNGKRPWKLNPQFRYKNANFNLPNHVKNSEDDILILPEVTIIDEFDRPHKLLSYGHRYDRKGKYWYAEP